MKNFSTKFHPDSHHHAKESHNQETRRQIKETIEEEEKARCEWDFSLSTIVSSRNNSTASISDALGVIEFDQTNSIVATGGIARKIRIYNLESLLPHESTGQDVHHTVCLDHARAGDYYICTPAKLSSLRWKPGSDGRVLGSGDYDGVVMEYDLERRVPIFERDEHGGRRVWSVDYSHCDPAMGASGSDDGTMQMWDTRSESGECVATVQPSVRRSAVCCVEFNPFGGPIVAIGCADRKVYGYDLRMMADPLFVLDGHRKTVTYIKFLDNVTLVSASIDGCLKLWNSDSSNVTRTYHGHVNSRSFVGLSVWRDGGLFGCGSENNKVFVYDKDGVNRFGFTSLAQRVEMGLSVVFAGGKLGRTNARLWQEDQMESCKFFRAEGSHRLDNKGVNFLLEVYQEVTGGISQVFVLANRSIIIMNATVT